MMPLCFWRASKGPPLILCGASPLFLRFGDTPWASALGYALRVGPVVCFEAACVQSGFSIGHICFFCPYVTSHHLVVWRRSVCGSDVG